MNGMDTTSLARAIGRGDRGALAKGISIVENEPKTAERLLRYLRPPGRAFVLGITGPPGTGKSTLVDRLIDIFLEKGLKVGVIAVDPTSPIAGGALLGDRVRMLSHSDEKDVYIRSMASRGWSGGLSRATSQVVQLMDAAGFGVVLLETVGIGQSDIEVVGVSHAVLVILMPGLGDDVQISKAGLMEVGDVYVVNKSDLEGADLLAVSLLSLVRSTRNRNPRVVKVSALTGDGLDDLRRAIEEIMSKFVKGGREMRLKSIRGMVIETAKADVLQKFVKNADSRSEKLALQVLEGRSTIEQAATRLAGGVPISSRSGRKKGR